MNRKTRAVLSKLLVGIGCLQMAGYLLGQPWLKSLGAVTVASPLPIVFTEVKGVETFALDFELHVQDEASTKSQTIPITSELYAAFEAPYNFRNVLGAAVSYGPILPEEITSTVLTYAFQSPGSIASDFGLNPPLENAYIQIESRTAGRDQVWRLPIDPLPSSK